ncbi:putative esterase [Lachnellula hyalina]|uniref:Putative esterase n=1 Tax=Lachnellula hyalina TaxID=1316788 RepID=A0A8H8R2K1_9HELO|nr:putative esterase [Lachnellula hyalina]TVY27328.1 putative esterase [Lachnellula hyalina]
MAALKFVRSVLKSFQVESGLEPRLFGENLRVTAAEPGRVEFELDILKEHTNRLSIIHGGTIASMVDLGGSLAVASRGLYATGVSTDLNVTYLNSGGQVGDVLKAIVKCDKCELSSLVLTEEPASIFRQNPCIYINRIHQRQRRYCCARQSYKVSPSEIRMELPSFMTVTKLFTLLNIWQIRRQAWKHPENIVEQLSPRK